MSDTVLTAATREWSSRPADERFNSLESLERAVRKSKENSVEERRTLENVSAIVRKDGRLALSSGKRAFGLTHYSFGQVCRVASAPQSYLRELPAELARDCINNGLQTAETARSRVMLLRNDGANRQTLRALTTDSEESGRNYARIYNLDVVHEVQRLQAQYPQWQPAPKAFDGSRGLYASDHDLFMFMVDNERRIFESLPGGGLGRGFFCRNSEEGDGAFWVMGFKYEYICGNHRVWGAQIIGEQKTKHVGDVKERAWDLLGKQLAIEAGKSAKDDEDMIKKARKTLLGETRDAVLAALNGLHWPELSQKLAGLSYITAEQNEDKYGDPRSVWGLTGGMTQVARDLPFADERHRLDKAAGKILSKFAGLN